MKIAMIGHKVVPSTKGGIETVLTNLCPIIAGYGHEVTCYNRSSDKSEDVFAGDINHGRYKGVVLKKAPTLKLRGISAMLASFTAAVKCSFSKCDIVHFHAEGPSAAMFIPKLFGKKCVATVHGLDWQRAKWKNGFGAKYIKFGERMLVKYADGVIVLSESAKEYFRETYDKSTTVIYNGIKKPEIIGDEIIKRLFGISRGSYICLVSRLTEEKGVHYLIDAYKGLRTDKKLVICGDTSDTDDYAAHLRKMADGNENIIFTGFISGDTLASVYSNAYAVCLPSDIEGMSLSLLEAMSYGNAVICSDIPENTAVCGDAALTFKKGDVADLKGKLNLLLENKEKTEHLRDIAAGYVLSRFSWDKTADATCELYDNILKGENDLCKT